MKHTIERKKEFTPITLTITIESEQELMELWARFNMAEVYVKEYNMHKFKVTSWDGKDRTYSVWED